MNRGWWRRPKQDVSQQSESGPNVHGGRDAHYHQEVHIAAAPPPLHPLNWKAQRFLQAYEWHGIDRGEIPDFLAQIDGPALTYGDMTEDRLINCLTREHLDITTETFALDRAWLHQPSATKVLRSFTFYKEDVRQFARFLLVGSRVREYSKLWGDSPVHAGGVIYFLASEVPSIANFEQQHMQVGAILKVPILDFHGRTIYRYFAIDDMDWSYWKCHYALVALMAIADECGLIVLGRLVTANQVSELSGGYAFPDATLLDSHGNKWSPRYPFLGLSMHDGNNDYKRRWASYRDLYRERQYKTTVHEAKEERRRLMWGDVSDS
jgi:hypothetical protein